MNRKQDAVVRLARALCVSLFLLLFVDALTDRAVSLSYPLDWHLAAAGLVVIWAVVLRFRNERV